MNVLLIEDNPADARFLEKTLAAAGKSLFKVTCVSRLSKAIERLKEESFDLVLLDLSLPDGQGISTFSRLRCEAPSVPVVVLSGTDDESLALNAVHMGAQDYIVKGQLHEAVLVRSLRYAIERAKTDERIRQLNEVLERRVIDLARANEDLDVLTKSLMLARDQALHASHFKSEFVAKMSHEVRTPISALVSMIEILARTPLTDEQEGFVDILSESSQSLLSIVNEILDFSKVEAGKIELKVSDFSPVSLVEGTCDLMSTVTRKKGLMLLSYIAPDVPVCLVGDAVRLRQILLNLLNNAVKFAESGEIVVKATLEASAADNYTIRFSVTDTGIGMSDSAMDKLFQPFSQVGASAQLSAEGTGLGLSICKRLVELMGGQIGVESREGKGSTFWFSVTLKRSSNITTPASIPLSAMGIGLDNKRLLIVDKNATSRDFLQRYARAIGMKVGSAASAEEALGILRQAHTADDPYCAAIVDLASDNEAFSKEIGDDPTLSQTKLIYLTSLDQRGQGEQAWQSGYAGYLTKPVKQVNLISCLSMVINEEHDDDDDLTHRLSSEGDSRPPSKLTKSLPAIGPASDRPLILVAEDSAALQLVAKTQLGKIGYRVDIVANGRLAVEAVRSKQYNAILMDCQMPEMDGFNASAEIRKLDRENGRHTPIIAMTASVRESDEQKCIRAGMDDYLSKPVNLEQLRQKLAFWTSDSEKVRNSPD